MSFFHPVIIESAQDFLAKFDNNLSDDFMIGPYDFNMSNFLNNNNSNTFLLFNFPEDIIVYIGSTRVTGDIFDYFNPLIVNSRILKNVQFVKKSLPDPITNFKCYALTSKLLKNHIPWIVNTPIFYPPGFTIDYNNIIVSRLNLGKQVCDFILKNQSIANIPIPIPFRGSGVDFSPNISHIQQISSVNGYPIYNIRDIILNITRSLDNVEEDSENHEEEIPSLEEHNNLFDTSSDQPEDGETF